LVQFGFSSMLASVLIIPGIWSELTNLHPTGNQSLPSAYDSRASGVNNSGLVQLDEQLLAYLLANTQGVYYLMAVSSSMQGADYILATGRPVLYVGGFTGQDSVVTPEELASLVNTGKLRFIYWSSSPSGLRDGTTINGQSQIITWVIGHCKVVPEYSRFSPGFPGEPGISLMSDAVEPYQGQPNILYDCGN
jgi:4-amino-4-deoxy-L-arabinose transferase-like glycosyltransferase